MRHGAGNRLQDTELRWQYGDGIPGIFEAERLTP
jgi:hypothetical protein